jgi:glycogen phosphorylase
MTEFASIPLGERIQQLASDLWWSWNPMARDVFRRLDYALWRQTDHNPIKMLKSLPAGRLEALAGDADFMECLEKAIEQLNRAQSRTGTWWHERYPSLSGISIAYFSAEFGIHQSVPLYAGGLGVLAGDHCKEASDLGIPLIGLGFRYSMGYFQQIISPDGNQVENYNRFPISETPLERAHKPDGEPCTVTVSLAGGVISIAVWLLRMGGVKVYLLDTDIEDNPEWARELSARLYVGELESRLQQEIVLGFGGVRALRALGHDPAVWHLNEGHAGFVILERIRELLDAGKTLDEARDIVRSATVFTTHTPVPAGHDTFPLEWVEKQLVEFQALNREARSTLFSMAFDDGRSGQFFNMTVLALRGSASCNAVSQAHRDVTRSMFRSIFEGRDDAIRGITNGVHIPTWIAPAMDALFQHYLGADWKDRRDDPLLWEKVLAIPDEELWRVRESLRACLLDLIRGLARDRWANQETGAAQLAAGGALLDANALTIGFSRRFTDYKRPELIFRDEDRLVRLLNAGRHPFQIIFAGKAHPADDPGKRSLQRIYRRAADHRFGGRIAFVDEYNLHVGHFLVQGCDVWLNNPRKPMEACGTSGMKASINGVPHLSVADGWWSEGYTGSNGWLIDPGQPGDEAAEAEAIYRLLEEQIIPAFYERDARGVPRRWMSFVKQAIRTVAPHFSARRMVKQYAEQMYVPNASGARSALAS